MNVSAALGTRLAPASSGIYAGTNMTDSRCVLALITMMAATPALGAATTEHSLASRGARLLTGEAVEKLVSGSRISMTNAEAGTQTWTHGVRGNLVATLVRSAPARPINGQGTGAVDASGAYCVRIEWPKTVESWCRHILALDGAYYGVSKDPGQTEVTTLDVVQPNTNRLGTLTRLWSLARFASGGLGR
jgi:hypothetical protein